MRVQLVGQRGKGGSEVGEEEGEVAEREREEGEEGGVRRGGEEEALIDCSYYLLVFFTIF